LSHDDDPPIAILRARIQALPREAVDYVDRRAPSVIARLFPTEPPVTGFQQWAGTVDRAMLITATRLLSAEGGRIVEGRSRGAGKRSRPRLEPMIMGEVRGTGATRRRGGRPANEDRQALVMRLATDWLAATDEVPNAGRGDSAGFADLVYSAFQWLGLPEGSATHPLRRYWADVKWGRARTGSKNSEAASRRTLT
jgi:hypothetical protein